MMRFVIARFIVAALNVTLLAESAYAQAMGGAGRKRHQQTADKPAAQMPKADEKGYNATLKNLPNKPFDPWHGAR